MGTAAGMLAAARKSLGLRGRPNYITRDYAVRHGDVFLRAPWCDMSITWWARQSANTAAVLPGGDRAFTVWHAQDFQKIGRWHPGTIAELNRSKPGDIVFFDWGQSNTIGAIDHVGVIEKVLGDGRVQTIEGNTSDACLRRVRSASTIAGFGRPAYSSSETKEDDMPEPRELWEWDGIPAPPWKAAEGNKNWEPGTYLHWLYRNQAKQTELLTKLAAGEQADVTAIVSGVLSGLAPDKIAALVADNLPADMAKQVADDLAARLAS